MKWAHAAVGRLCLVAGSAMACLMLWALIDPAAIRYAGDAAAFATPPSRVRSAFGLVFSLFVAAIGFGMVRRPGRG